MYTVVPNSCVTEQRPVWKIIQSYNSQIRPYKEFTSKVYNIFCLREFKASDLKIIYKMSVVLNATLFLFDAKNINHIKMSFIK